MEISQLNEEEIIEEMKSLSPSEQAIQGLLDLYNKEKEKNKELTDLVETTQEFKRLNKPVMEIVHEMEKFEDEFISKDKIMKAMKITSKDIKKCKAKGSTDTEYLLETIKLYAKE